MAGTFAIAVHFCGYSSPITVMTIVRCRGLTSHSKWKTCCHAPKTKFPSLMGTVSDGPSIVACKCECPLPSCQALFVAVLTARREELVEHCRQVLLKSGLEFNRADGARAADIKNICHSSADT